MSTMYLNSYVHNPTQVILLLLMPNLEWIIFTEVKYENSYSHFGGCTSLFAGLEQWNDLWNGLKQNI